MEALRALEAVIKTVTKRTTSVEDELASDASSSSSGISRRGREPEFECDFHSGTLAAMETETDLRNMMLLMAQDSQDLKIALGCVGVSIELNTSVPLSVSISLSLSVSLSLSLSLFLFLPLN